MTAVVTEIRNTAGAGTDREGDGEVALVNDLSRVIEARLSMNHALGMSQYLET